MNDLNTRLANHIAPDGPSSEGAPGRVSFWSKRLLWIIELEMELVNLRSYGQISRPMAA